MVAEADRHVLVGEDEVNEGVLSVKNMESGEQVKLSPEEASKFIKNLVDEKNSGAVIKE
jgi:histidyl-tRNA synthetase